MSCESQSCQPPAEQPDVSDLDATLSTMRELDPDRQRIAHILIDLIAAVDVSDEDPALPQGWAAPFAVDLANLGAFTKLIDDDYDPPRESYDVTPLVSSMAIVMEILVTLLADAKDQDRLEVINDVRQQLDRFAAG